jgi:hypothetical protein
MATRKGKRMKTVSPGIRQKDNGKFIATKSFGKKRYYQEFDREVDARKWKKTFHPLLTSQASKKRNIFTVSDQSNGKDKSIIFAEVIEKYQK